MSEKWRTIDACRICGNTHLTPIMNFGEQYLASTFVESNETHPLSKTRIPLDVVLCDPSKTSGACGLVQLRHTVDRELMYREYFYRSATNPMMQRALREIALQIVTNYASSVGDYVLDIGCNDGTLLGYYPPSLNRIGIDPAENINRDQVSDEITIVQDFFTKETALKASGGNLYKAITAIAMFYDLDDPNVFVEDLKSVLAPDGRIVIQLSYLGTTLDTLNFYDFCHEHLLYYSLTTLNNLMARNGLRIVHAEENDVNGGSIRIHVVHADSHEVTTNSVYRYLKLEKRKGFTSLSTYRAFMERVDTLRDLTHQFLRKEKEQGGVVVALGASTKGNVLLQFFDIGKDLLPYISDRNPEKVGLRTLGTDIEVISEERARALNPSAMFVSIWFFKEEILKREQGYLASGGKLFFPMPYPHVVTKDGEFEITPDSAK